MPSHETQSRFFLNLEALLQNTNCDSKQAVHRQPRQKRGQRSLPNTRILAEIGIPRIKQVYQSRHDKHPLVARRCHLANNFTNFRHEQTNKRTDKQKDSITA